MTLLMQPGLLLIDFGHFQYNSVMLGLSSVHMLPNMLTHLVTGFTLLSISCFAAGNDLLGAISFILSLGFKQMALYYAPAVGSYLLAKCLSLGAREGYGQYTVYRCKLTLMYNVAPNISFAWPPSR